MAYTPLNSTDNGSTSRATINSNFSSVDTQLADRVTFTGTAPVDGDLTVFSGITGKVLKKKVFTASQVLESDSNGQPTSAAKGTGYNLNLGTTAGTVLEGSNDANYVKLTGDQTVNGVKTFGSIPVGPASDPTTSNQLARKAYVDANTLGVCKVVQSTRNMATASGTQTVSHSLGRTPKLITISAVGQMGGAGTCRSLGGYDGTNNYCTTSYSKTGTGDGAGQQVAHSISIVDNTANSYIGAITAWSSTDFTITWTQSGSPTGTLYFTATLI